MINVDTDVNPQTTIDTQLYQLFGTFLNFIICSSKFTWSGLYQWKLILTDKIHFNFFASFINDYSMPAHFSLGYHKRMQHFWICIKFLCEVAISYAFDNEKLMPEGFS